MSRRSSGGSHMPSRLSVDLFELTRVVSVRRAKTAGLAGTTRTAVELSTWQQNDSVTILILALNNNMLIMRLWDTLVKRAVVKILPWFENASWKILVMCLSPEAEWLACVCQDYTIHLVPCYTLLTGENVKVNKWSLKDITTIQQADKQRVVTCAVWWETHSKRQILITGCKKGRIEFVDLVLKEEVFRVQVPSAVASIELLGKTSARATYLLIRVEEGQSWQMILEALNDGSIFTENVSWTADGSLSEFVSCVDEDRMPEPFYPSEFKLLHLDVKLSCQKRKDRLFMAVHDLITQRFELLNADMALQDQALFTYKLLQKAYLLQFTEIIMFVVCQQAKQPPSLHILSSQLAASVPPTNKPPKEEPSSSDNVLQSFSLPEDEELLSLYLCCQPSEMIDAASNADQDLISHSVLDSCFIVTTQGVYHCRQKRSPEQIFLEMATECDTFDATDKLGIALQLDICGLYQIAGERRLAKNEFSQAMDLFKLANCPSVKLVRMFVEKGRLHDVMPYIEMVLSEQDSRSSGDSKALADFLLHCYVQQILETRECSGRRAKLVEKLSQFVNDNFAYDDRSAMKLLASNGLIDLTLQVAKARAKVSEATDLLVKQGSLQLHLQQTANLTSTDHASAMATCYDGVLFRCMQPQDFVRFLLSQPDLIPQWLTYLLSILPILDQHSLLRIARFFDPSRSAVRYLLSRSTGGRQRRYSTGSIASLSSATLNDARETFVEPTMEEYIEFFLLSVLTLKLRRLKEPLFDCSFVLPTIDQGYAAVSASSAGELRRRPTTPTVAISTVPLSCGQSHAAAVIQGDVYTWGQTQNGRLGHGDIIAEEGRSAPLRVEILHMMGIQVLSVACGAEHTLALCTEGVYSWGCGTYGQLGLGDTHHRTRPAHVAELSGKCCVAVACGRYHSLALTQDRRVWSWGWNVHSQLGQGGIEDILVPTHVKVLDRHQVAKISGGNYHTAVLTIKGKVLTFGNGIQGQLGLGSITKTVTPQVIESLQDVYLLDCGLFHTVAATKSQRVFMWGRQLKPVPRVDHLQGQRPRPSRRHRVAYHSSVPQRIMCVLDSKISQLWCGANHCQLLTETGWVYSWGANECGQLGYELKQEVLIQTRPKMVSSIGNKIRSIACGDQFSAAMDINGRVWVWGREDQGQLGFEMREIVSVDGFKFTSQPTLLQGLTVKRNRKVTNPDVQEEEEALVQNDDQSETSIVFELDWDALPAFSREDPAQLAYDQGALKEALRCLSGIYRSHLILRHVIAWQDWESVAFIYELKANWSQCLKYKLKAAASLSSEKTREKVVVMACQAIMFCTEQLAAEANIFDIQQIAMQMLQQICYFWHEQKISIQILEKTLSQHLTVYGSSLCHLCLSVTCIDDADQGQQDDCLWSIVKTFSVEFQLKVLASVTAKMSQCSSRSLRRQRNGGTTVADELEDTEGREDGDGEEFISSLTIEDERLWNEILNNLGKDLNKRVNVLLNGLPEDSGSEMDTENQQSGVDIVCFTTGKAHTAKAFEQVMLPQFRLQLKQVSSDTPLANKSVLDHYQQSPLIALASPDALLDALRLGSNG